MSTPEPLQNAIRTFESLVYAHRHAEALEALAVLLERLEPEALVSAEASPAQAAAAHARLAAAVVALLTAPQLVIDGRVLARLLVGKRVLADLFGPTGFDADALLAWCGASRDDEGRLGIPRDRIAACLALVQLPDVRPFLDGLPRLNAGAAQLLALGLLCEPIVLTREEERGRNWLIDHPERYVDAPLNAAAAARLASAWMFCSYADHPRRHRLKAALNGVVRRWAAKKLGRVPACPPRGADPSPAMDMPAATTDGSRAAIQARRPTVVVLVERFRAGHAMHRVYAPSIRQLRARYRVILMGPRQHLDRESLALADLVIAIDPHPNALPGLVERIESLRPDLIFYPSIGMSFWTIALANLRLAPIQCMSIGHPASSFADTVDYMILGRDVLGDPACFSETVVVRDAPGNPVQPHPGRLPPPPAPRESPEVLRIAVPAMAMKLSPAFLETCLRLRAEAGRPVHFRFFPNRKGISFRHVQAELLRLMPDATVDPATTYEAYMEALADCDLALATFPFGNANSTVDVLLLGKPVVALEGDEPAARTDRRMLRLAGAPDWLLAASREEYHRIALRLVTDDTLRVRTAQAILAADPGRALFETERARYPTDFADTIAWIHRNHERIRADGRKVWLPEDRSAASAAGPGA